MVTSEKKSSPPNFVYEQCYFSFHSLCRVFFLTLLPGEKFYFNCKARLGGEICSSGINMYGGFCFVRLFNFRRLPMDYLY